MKLVFATHNQHKFEEVKKLVPSSIELLSLNDISCYDDIAETGKTLEENAKIKADYITQNYGLSCFADDTGLLVDALDGQPGVYSARYAGQQKSDEDNMNKLLRELNGKNNRNAHFKTVIALNLNNDRHLFEGIVNGTITREKAGQKGFGYDPIFKPSALDKTFAELPIEVKNKISHRGKAVQHLIDFLKTKP